MFNRGLVFRIQILLFGASVYVGTDQRVTILLALQKSMLVLSTTSKLSIVGGNTVKSVSEAFGAIAERFSKSRHQW